MIYLLSDIHSDTEFSGLKNYCDIAQEDDLLIILGDIGLNFEQSEENRKFTEYFLSIEKNIAFLDGNHDNFEYLNSFPEEEWNNGTVHRLTPHIVHLKRGSIFTIEGKTLFTFGGCKSSPKWKEMGLWYPGEEPTEEELSLAHNNLKIHNYNIDYILTHKYEQTPPRGTLCEKLQKLTNFIEENVRYKKWYAGHWHTNTIFDDNHAFIYEQLTSVE